MNHHQKHLSACLIALAALFSTAPMAWAATAESQVPALLATTLSYGAYGGTGVTCETPSALPLYTVTGDVGTSGLAPTLVTGFPPPLPSLCSLLGTVRLGDLTTWADVFGETTGAYLKIQNNIPCTPDTTGTLHNLSGELGGMTLPPGVYCNTSGVWTLNAGTLTLDLTAPGGDGGTVWIFKGYSSITTAGTTAVRSQVVMAHGGNTCNVYWQLPSDATFSLTDFVGNVLSGTDVTFTGSSLAGRAFAQTDVTMKLGSSITSCGPVVGGKGDGGKGDGGKGDGNGHDKDKDHKDDSRHSFKDGGNPFDKDGHGDRK